MLFILHHVNLFKAAQFLQTLLYMCIFISFMTCLYNYFICYSSAMSEEELMWFSPFYRWGKWDGSSKGLASGYPASPHWSFTALPLGTLEGFCAFLWQCDAMGYSSTYKTHWRHDSGWKFMWVSLNQQPCFERITYFWEECFVACLRRTC